MRDINSTLLYAKFKSVSLINKQAVFELKQHYEMRNQCSSTHPEDDPTNLLKSPVQGIPTGGMNYPVNQGPDKSASVITLGSRLEMLAASHNIFGAALDYDPSTGSYKVVLATLNYKFLDALKAHGSNSERAP
eukprot:3893748-Ditylum_brightwellii.AAC.1